MAYQISDNVNQVWLKENCAYDSYFQQHLIDHDVYPEGYGGVKNSQEPDNQNEINERLALPRASLSSSRFTCAAFLDFKEKNQEALNEAEVMSTAFPVITGSACIPHSENLRFNNLKNLIDSCVTQGQLDYFDENLPTELDGHI